MVTQSVRTDRLLLRHWQTDDLDPFSVMNADPAVMEHFPNLLTKAESDALVAKFRDHFEKHGFGRWAVERSDTSQFIGFVGLSRVTFETPFTPCVEIGWRLAREHWGQGFASEAALAAIRHGFEQVGLDEIVAFTVPANTRSWALMERIGMKRSIDGDFDHPVLPEGHHLRRHVLYRIQHRHE